jgi:hypothetical protein
LRCSNRLFMRLDNKRIERTAQATLRKRCARPPFIRNTLVTLRGGCMSLLDEALGASECVISVMGAHAGEDAATIFERKVEDCRTAGRTFWVAKSAKARPQQVRATCSSGHGYVLFVEPASPNGARATTESASAKEYSPDRIQWFPLPEGLGPVTGQMDGHAAALVFDELKTGVDRTLDL